MKVRRNSFVLSGVTERPADSAGPIQPVPLAIYLVGFEGLKALVGDFVDVTGQVTERSAKPGTVTVSIDSSETRSTDVQVASGNKDLDVTTKKFDDMPRPTGTSSASSSLETTRPVYKLIVEQVRRSVYIADVVQACRFRAVEIWMRQGSEVHATT